MRKVISRRIRRQRSGVNVVADVQGVVAANVGKPGETSRSSAKSHIRVVQRDGETEFTESQEHDDD